MPVGLLTRPMYASFPEYHTSLDDLEFVSGDAIAESLSRDISNRIEREMEYPGQIRVTVIREVRSVSVAK